jgi:hypothetical protein
MGLLEFEQLDDVARWVFEQNGPASSTIADAAAEVCVGPAQPLDQMIQLLGDDHEPVPPARLRIAAGLTTASRTWGAKIQGQVVATVIDQLCKRFGLSVYNN